MQHMHCSYILNSTIFKIKINFDSDDIKIKINFDSDGGRRWGSKGLISKSKSILILIISKSKSILILTISKSISILILKGGDAPPHPANHLTASKSSSGGHGSESVSAYWAPGLEKTNSFPYPQRSNFKTFRENT